MLEDVIKQYGGVEVSPMEVYTDIFHLGENELQKTGEPSGAFKTNPIGYWKNKDKQKGHYRIMFDDTFEDTLKELQEADFNILNGITYFGRKNLQENASKMYAMIIDYDGVTDKSLNNFLHGAFLKEYDIYPIPNYIALSGHGIHLYYLFEDPIPLYPNIKMQLKAFKYAMIEKIWNMYTSEEEHKQFQGINQGFRVIGGKSKIEGVRVRAFRMHQHPYSLTELGRYIPEESRVDESKLWKESTMSLAEAKRKYPEWYERKVLNKEPKGHWQCKEDLYQWWIRKIKEGATYHHRYFNIMCLAIYGVKCGKTFEAVEADALALVPFLNGINPSEPFTEQDVYSALECFDMRYCTFPIDDIVKVSGIPIEKNIRHGRKQTVHLRSEYWKNDKGRPEINVCRHNRELALKYMREHGEIKGRPSTEQQIREYLEQHPDAKKCDVIRDLGLTKPTVYKWWKVIKENKPVPVAEPKAETKPEKQTIKITAGDGAELEIDIDTWNKWLKEDIKRAENLEK